MSYTNEPTTTEDDFGPPISELLFRRAEEAEREVAWAHNLLDRLNVPREEYAAQARGVIRFTLAGRIDRLAAPLHDELTEARALIERQAHALETVVGDPSVAVASWRKVCEARTEARAFLARFPEKSAPT